MDFIFKLSLLLKIEESMFESLKKEWPYYFLTAIVIIIGMHSVNKMLTDPLTDIQLMEIKSKITAYNLEFVSTEDKQFFGCGNGDYYRVPVKVKNKEGTIFTINYCSGSISRPSQIKI